MNLFVTGGHGRMGKYLIPQLETIGWTVTAPPSVLLDITNEASVISALEVAQPDIVLHLAAYTDVAKAELERARCWQVNVVGTRNLARHSRRRFVHFSTDYVFDGERGMYAESDAPNPSNYYSLTKTVAEEAARAAYNSLIVRTTFKDAIWRHPVAFNDQFTSADFTDVIGQEILILMLNLERIQDNVLHVVTERKSVYELAHRRNENVQAGSRLSASVHIPPDVSLDNRRWQELKADFVDASSRAKPE